MSVSTCVASLARQLDSLCTNPEILGEKRAKTGWVGGWGAGGWEIRLLAVFSLCFPAKCRLLAKGCGFFVPKWVWLGIS